MEFRLTLDQLIHVLLLWGKAVSQLLVIDKRMAHFGIFLTDKGEENTCLGEQQPEEESKWVWLLDLQRSVALAVGRCLGGMLQGPPPSLQEKTSDFWLSNVLLRNGLETDFEQLGRKTWSMLLYEPMFWQVDVNCMQWSSRI